MSVQVAPWPAGPEVEYSVAARESARRLQLRLIAVAALAAAVGLGVWGASVANAGHILEVLGFAALMLPVLLWRRPVSGPVLLVIAATLVEQFGGEGPGGLVSEKLPMFKSLADGFRITGVYLTPVELGLALIMVVWFLRSAAGGTLHVPRSYLGLTMLLVLLLAGLAEARGLASGGDLKFSLWELRPWVYLAAAYLLGSQLITSDAARAAVLAAFVAGTGIKGIQGTVNLFATRDMHPRPESILAHEESFFFGIYIALVAALWAFGLKGRLRWWATALLPFVLLADLANGRRTAWVIIPAALVVVALVTWIRQPERRPALVRSVVVLAAGLAIYLPFSWNSGGYLGEPARAIRSAIAPAARDRSSNDYRRLEDANLFLNIHHSGQMGSGFGAPITYSIPIIDLSSQTALIRYVPHNSVVYIWMRLGLFGMVLFWWLVGAALAAACALARHGTGLAALLGTLGAVTVLAYLVQGAYDYGFFWFRVALFVGTMLGAVEAGLGAGRVATVLRPAWTRRGDRALGAAPG